MVDLVGHFLLFMVVAIGFLLVPLLIGRFVRPKLPNAEKDAIYECGEPTIGTSYVQFDLRFYVVALLFIIFDVEVAFFFPWATIYGNATQLADPNLSEASRKAISSELLNRDTVIISGIQPIGITPRKAKNVITVEAGSVAEKVGLKTGDEITSLNVNGTQLGDSNELVPALQELSLKSDINLEIELVRSGATLAIEEEDIPEDLPADSQLSGITLRETGNLINVEKGSLAYEAGFRTGDEVQSVKLADSNTLATEKLVPLLQYASAGTDASTEILRSGESQTFVLSVPFGAYQVAQFGFYDILIFFGVLLVGFAYVWKRGDLDWVRAVAEKAKQAAARPKSPPSLQPPTSKPQEPVGV